MADNDTDISKTHLNKIDEKIQVDFHLRLQNTENFALKSSRILDFFSPEPKLPLIPKVGPSPSTKKLLLKVTARDDELFSTPKIITFLADPLSKVQEPALSTSIS